MKENGKRKEIRSGKKFLREECRDENERTNVERREREKENRLAEDEADKVAALHPAYHVEQSFSVCLPRRVDHPRRTSAVNLPEYRSRAPSTN